jgi:hypothetical protein
VVAGTRVAVELILEKLATGESIEQILAAQPHLTRGGIRAEIASLLRLATERPSQYDLVPMLGGDELPEVSRIRGHNGDLAREAYCLRRDQHIHIESLWVSGGPSLLPRAGSEFSRQAERIVRPRQISVSTGIHERVQASDAGSLSGPQTFSLEFVLHDNATPNQQEPR